MLPFDWTLSRNRRGVSNPTDCTPFLSIEKHNDIIQSLSALSEDETETDGAHVEMPVPADVIEPGVDDHIRKYRRLMSLAKEIIQKASLNNERYDDILGVFLDLRTSLVHPVDGEIRDSIGHPRGRP
jgi:hypothetical protein